MNLVMVGFMGSGKTTVGRRLSKRLGYSFFDTDQFIESEVGCSVPEIFSIQGEAYFRELESRVADHLHRLANTVIATGGGLLTTPGNLDRLRRAGPLIFLKVQYEDLLKRLGRDSRRPKIQGGSLEETVTRLMDERLPVYEQSDLIVETKGKSINRVCGEILRNLANLSRQRETVES